MLHSRQWRIMAALAAVLSVSVALSAESVNTSLSPDLLDSCIDLGSQYLVNSQRPPGNFHYQYDFVNRTDADEDSMTRQVGAVWGLALLYHHEPDDTVEAALRKGLAYFRGLSVNDADKGRRLVYPTAGVSATNAQALICLTLIDYLRAKPDAFEGREQYEKDLEEYLRFLMSLRRDDGRFYPRFWPETGKVTGRPNPYADGEALLVMVKAARYAGRNELKTEALKLAPALHEAYVEQALKDDPDSALTKGFYQWGSMSFFEMADAGWEGAERFSRWTIDLARWMIDVHKTLTRTRNTAYAYEGIVSAHELARRAGDDAAQLKFRAVIDEGLFKLCTWQVGSPVANEYIREHPTEDPLAVGGCLNHASEPYLRIDVTQHQMHALILARRYVFPPEK